MLMVLRNHLLSYCSSILQQLDYLGVKAHARVGGTSVIDIDCLI